MYYSKFSNGKSKGKVHSPFSCEPADTLSENEFFAGQAVISRQYVQADLKHGLFA